MARPQRHPGRPLVLGVGAAALLASATCLGPALAQDGGGLLFTLGLSTTLSAKDDSAAAGTTVLSDTRLSFGLESVTRTQALSLLVSDRLQFGDGPDAPADPGFLAPEVRLDYLRQSRNARLVFGASLVTRDLDDSLTEADLDGSESLILDSGTVRTRSLDLEVETGLAAPVGASLSLSERRRDYSGTTDPDLYDSVTRSAGAALILRPDPTTEARLSFDYGDFAAEDANRTARITQALVLALSRDLDPVTSVGASLGWTEITETWRAFGVALPPDRGLTGALTFARALPAGSVSADLSHAITSQGGRTDLSVGRVVALPTGELSYALGLTEVAGSGLQPSGRLGYVLRGPDRALGVDLSSGVVVSSDSGVERATQVDVTYSFELTEIESLSFDVGYAVFAEAGAGAVTDRSRATLTASYDRALTPDWTLRTGYSYRHTREEGSPATESNTLFVTLGRDFSWRP